MKLCSVPPSGPSGGSWLAQPQGLWYDYRGCRLGTVQYHCRGLKLAGTCIYCTPPLGLLPLVLFCCAHVGCVLLCCAPLFTGPGGGDKEPSHSGRGDEGRGGPESDAGAAGTFAGQHSTGLSRPQLPQQFDIGPAIVLAQATGRILAALAVGWPAEISGGS